MKYFRQKKFNPLAIAKREAHLIMENYSFVECKIQNNGLYCYGNYQPTPESILYQYRIKYIPISAPIVTVTEPNIEYNDEIHMYPKDNALCLYHSSDLIWNSNSHLYDTIIPWTHEWFIFYELYLITGEWRHPYVPHKRGDKKQ